MESQSETDEQQIVDAIHDVTCEVALAIGKGAQSEIGANIEFLEKKKAESYDSSDDEFYESQINMQKNIYSLMETSMTCATESYMAKAEIAKLQRQNSKLEAELATKNEEISQLKKLIEETKLIIQDYPNQLKFGINES